MGQILNGPDGCGRNWSKLTVYPGIRQLQPPTEIKGNIWIVHLDLNNREEMSKHIPTHKWNHMAVILPGSGSKVSFYCNSYNPIQYKPVNTAYSHRYSLFV